MNINYIYYVKRNKEVTMNTIKNLLGESNEYITVNPANFGAGHGNGLSVKIVIPAFCQAKCPFCFNNCTIETQKHDFKKFFVELRKSLDMVFTLNRSISLDITGNEPTFNVPMFEQLMFILRDYKEKTSKIVLTTNGFHLRECLPSMAGVVDIVNISLHHYDENVRKNEILRTNFIPTNAELKEIIKIGNECGITFTAVAVLYKKFEIFKNFYNKFVEFARTTGFKDIRFRCNYVEQDDFTTEVMNTKFDNYRVEHLKALNTIYINENGYDVRIMAGVPDLTEIVVGAELVIDDDGKTYVDYNKRYAVNQENVNTFNYIYLLK